MCFKFFNQIVNHKKDNDIECIELMMEYSITQNNEQCNLNSTNEIDTFTPYFLDYIRRIIGNDEEIIIKKNQQEVRIASNETKKMIEYIMSGDIVIRDKKFVKIFPILQLIYQFETGRKYFINQLKELNITYLLQTIDEKYVELYRLKKCTHINLDRDLSGIPRFSLYNYLMTFEKKSTSLSIEDGILYMYYTKDDVNYKIGLGIDNNLYDIVVKKVNNMDAFYISIYPEKSYFSRVMNFESSYIEKIFAYHHLDFYTILTNKYKNYKFNIGFIKSNISDIYGNYDLTLFID